jgi:hypothetical protein
MRILTDKISFSALLLTDEMPASHNRPNRVNAMMDFFKPRPIPSPEKSTASPLVLNEAEACAAVLLACVRANEIDDGSENSVYSGTIRTRNIFIGHDPKLLTDIVSALYEQLGSPEALVDAATDMIREQTRLPLFYHCLDVIMADGLVTPSEHRIFLHLKKKFGIDDELATEALEVLLVKNLL